MEIESRIEKAIATKFDVDFKNYANIIKHYDRAMLKAEKLAMWPDDPHEWQGFDEIEHVTVGIRFWSPQRALKEFGLRCIETGIEV
jgi:hypothetical protein